jgi:hypothetical protein
MFFPEESGFLEKHGVITQWSLTEPEIRAISSFRFYL